MHNLLMQFFTLGSSKIKVSETYFFDIVTTQYDHPRCHFMCFSAPGSSKIKGFETYFFDAVIT